MVSKVSETTLTMGSKKYVQVLEEYIKSIEKLEPKDRLDYGFAIAECLNGMLISIRGWADWLNDLSKLRFLSVEELDGIFTKIKSLSVPFIKIDVDITNKKIVEAKMQLVETKQNKLKELLNNKHQTYVS